MGKVVVIADGLFGSAGKGGIAAYLAAQYGQTNPPMLVRVAGPNAGHSAIGCLDGKKYAMCQIPVAAVTSLNSPLVTAAGSEIDPEVISREADLLDAAGYHASERLMLDSAATFMAPDYAASEVAGGMWERLGSTAHGIGAARAARIMRVAETWGQALDTHLELKKRFHECTRSRTDLAMMEHLAGGGDVMIEGTQGWGLGLHTEYYPKCTSSDARAIDFMAMCGISPWAPEVEAVEPFVVVRTYPIRVAGNSGPLPNEISWEILAERTNGYIKPEITTVTKRIRRVSEWNGDLAAQAIVANGGPQVVKVALTFFDYLYPQLAGATDRSALTDEMYAKIEQLGISMGVIPSLIGTGPGSVIDLRDDPLLTPVANTQGRFVLDELTGRPVGVRPM